MDWIKNLPVSRKFTFAFGTVCGLCIILGAYTFVTFRSIATKSADVSNNAVVSLIALSGVSDAASTVRREDLELLLCQTTACSTDHGTKRQKALDNYQSSLKAYVPAISYPGEKEIYQKFSTAYAQYLDASNKVNALLAAGKTGDALDLLTSDATMATLSTALKGITDDVALNAKYGSEDANGVTSSSQGGSWIDAGFTLVIVMLCAGIGLVLTRLIAPPLLAATAALERVADKDLTVSVAESGTDEIGRLSAALNTSVTSMRSVLVAVAQGAETLSSATTQMSARSIEAAGNANSQASKTN